MKVMHVETGRHLYGGALQVFYLLRGLKEKGVDNLLVCPTGSAIAEKASDYAAVHELPMRGELDLPFGFRLWRLLRQEAPDILHIHSRRGADFWGSLVVRMTRLPAVLTRRVDNPEPGAIAAWKYAPFARVVAISEGIRQLLLAEGLNADKVRCIHSAVDYHAWQYPADRAWFAAEFGVRPEHKVVGVIAQLIARKGHRYLIDAIPEIVAQEPRARFLFLGQGPMETQLKQQCVELGVNGFVGFAGFREDLPLVLPNLDLVVHPALMEGLGVSLLQAAAAGVPILGGRAGGIPEIVRDGVNGYLFDPRDVRRLAGLVGELLTDDEKRRVLGQGGRKIVIEDFSIERMVSENLREYETIRGN